MKKAILFLSATLLLLASCSKEVIDDNATPADPTTNPKLVTFNLTGDFTLAPTRALTADGKDMTDIWLFDCDYDGLLQQLHQSSSDADFGSPTLSLSYGTHYLYVVISRSQSPVVNIADETITFGSVRDTFWATATITVNADTPALQSITLDRVVTKLKLTFADAIPADAATFNVTPATWYYGLNYITGEPVLETINQPITVTIPSSSIGVAGESVSIFGFSSSTEWTTNIAINSKTSTDAVLGSAAIAAAPFRRNRVTEYSGTLWTLGGSFNISLNTAWDDSYTGTW